MCFPFFFATTHSATAVNHRPSGSPTRSGCHRKTSRARTLDFCPSVFCVHWLGHRAAALRVRHQLDLRLKHALRDRQLHLTWQYLPRATMPPAPCARRELVALSYTSRFCSKFDMSRTDNQNQHGRTSISAAQSHGQCTTRFHPMCSANEKRIILVFFLGSVSSLPVLDCDHFYQGSSVS